MIIVGSIKRGTLRERQVPESSSFCITEISKAALCRAGWDVEKREKDSSFMRPDLTNFAQPLLYNEGQKEGGLCITRCT